MATHYMSVCVHVESRCLHLLLSTLCFEKGPLAEPETSSLYQLSGQKDPDSCHLWPPNTGVTGTCHHFQHVTWMLVVGTQRFMLTRQALGWQNYLPKKLIYLCFLNWGLRSGMWGGKAVEVGSGEGRGCLIIRETSEERHMKRSLAYQQRCRGNTHQTFLEIMCESPHLISTTQHFISI